MVSQAVQVQHHQTLYPQRLAPPIIKLALISGSRTSTTFPFSRTGLRLAFFSPQSQILLPSRGNPRSEDRTLDFHIDLVERTHDSLDPVLVDLSEELLNRLFRLRGHWVRCNGGAGAAGARGRGLGRRVQEEEFDVCKGRLSVLLRSAGEGKGREVRTAARHEARYVVIVEAIDAFEIPNPVLSADRGKRSSGVRTFGRLPTALLRRCRDCCAR